MKNLKMNSESGKLKGGFDSLSEEQISKIKGGKRLSTNDACTNATDCSKADNFGACTNLGIC